MDTEKKITFVEYLALRELLKNHAQQRNRSYPTPPKHKIDITSVFTFLQSFSPSLVRLQPYFSEVDIESIEDLHECAKDPETIVQLGHRYVETGEMSPLELKMIEEKLVEVACGMLELEGSDK